jgi:hypothetical protein
LNAIRPLGFGLGALALFALWIAATAPAASAATLNVSGDWNITGAVALSDTQINVNNTSETDGFVNVLPGGSLTLTNCTLNMVLNRTLDVQGGLFLTNSLVDSPGWFFWIRGTTQLRNVELRNATHDLGTGFAGTYLVNASTVFQNVSWTSSNGEPAAIHVRIPFNFTGNYLGPGIGLSIELPPLSSNRAITIANNRFDGGGSGTNSIQFDPQAHVATVTFDIHDNNFTGGADAVRIKASSVTTRFLIHDNVFALIGNDAVDANDADIHGFYGFWNLSVTGCTNGFFLRAAQNDGVKATLENVSISLCTLGVIAQDTDLWVRNSTIDQTTTDYEGYFNGHIFIYDTTDTALSTLVDGPGGSVEHFTTLNLGTMSWQGSVPFQGQNLTLRNSTGTLGLVVNPANWTARDIVWWGSYYQLPNVDNRDLQPTVEVGNDVYGCAPSHFFVTRPMAQVNVVCTDDKAPLVTLAGPSGLRYQNSSTITAAGSVVDTGSGLSLIEWSFDNASWGPVTPVSGKPANFTISSPSAADGQHTVYFRARDRVGLTSYSSRGPIVVDTVLPPVYFDSFPARASGTSFDVTGSTEPLTPIQLLTAGGLRFTGASDASGRFMLSIPLVEGLNLFFVTATDYALNSFTNSSSILADNVPPSITVFNSVNDLTAQTSITISGLTDAGATVEVNGLAATRSAESFSRLLPLMRGLNAITVNATDDAGNFAQWFGTVTSDDDMPVLVAAVSADRVTDAGLPLTRSARATVTGSATDATSGVAMLLVGGVAAQVDGTGAFTMAVDLVEGENSFTVVAEDAVGNTQTLEVRVVRDTAAPTFSTRVEAGDGRLVNVSGTPTTDGNTLTLVVDLTAEAAEIEINGAASTGVQGENRITVNVVEGSNAFTIIVRDRAGNVALPRTVTAERDTTAPPLAFSSPVNGAAIEESFVQVAGVTEPGTTLVVNGGPVSVGPTGGFSLRVDLLPGANPVKASATDAMGNTRNATLTIARAEPTGNVDNSAGGLPAIPLLILGLVGGAVAGFVLGNRRAPPPDTTAPKARREEEPAPYKAPYEAPSAAPPTRGPRGPRPPGQ